MFRKSDPLPRRSHWIRGVNLGGWLVLERYITPYQFAITDCHLKGDLCWYPGQVNAPPKHSPDYKECDTQKCQAIRFPNCFGELDYPLDEYHLAETFDNKTTAERWLNYHFENFIQRDDLVRIKKAGLTHVRIPLPHWILGHKAVDEPYVAGDRWKYFVRVCQWCRELGLQVWPNIHTAPGSQNGFDNSGIQKDQVTCDGWQSVAEHVEQSLDVLQQVSLRILEDGLDDVVTGFGLLNEPFLDCDIDLYQLYLDNGLNIIRNTLGDDIYVFVSDMFSSSEFNNGRWWLDSKNYNRTLLDSHFYQVFAPQYRELSPRQHIAFACQGEHKGDGVVDCCYHDPPFNRQPSRGVQRLVSEWSAAFDTLPVTMLKLVMDGIADTGVAPLMDRTIPQARQDFMKNYVQAQMVAYEAANSGLVHGWFYWTIKMEGGAFAEWDFTRGLREGWIPPIPAQTVSSLDAYGTCYEILFRTNDTMDVVQEFPIDTSPKYWTLDDDVVVTHGESLLPGGPKQALRFVVKFNWLWMSIIVVLAALVWRSYRKTRHKWQYTSIDS